MKSADEEHLDRVIRHINNVRENCVFLGEKLIKGGEEDLGRKLIANGFVHDASKFGGIEWLYLREEIKEKDKEKFELAVQSHVTQNAHHPEFFGEIQAMPRIYLAEFVCDTKSRSEEFGTDFRDWIKDKATKKYKFSQKSKTFKDIKDLVDLLLESPFK